MSILKPPLPFWGTVYKLELKLLMLPTSLNKSLRTHRFAYQRKNQAWDNLIWAETRELKPPAPLKKAHLRIVRHSHRMLDYDGLVGSLKPVVDALVTAGIILDDRWGVLGKWDVDQAFRSKALGPMLELQLIEITEFTNDTCEIN